MQYTAERKAERKAEFKAECKADWMKYKAEC